MAAVVPSESQTPAAAAWQFGVHSEVGKLRRVMIHRPDLELKRLTPDNHDELLFDDVLWVRRARQQHDAFADLMRDRGIEVVYLEELLAETLPGDGCQAVGARSGGHAVHRRRRHVRRDPRLPRRGRRSHARRPPHRRADRRRGPPDPAGQGRQRRRQRRDREAVARGRRDGGGRLRPAPACRTATSPATHPPGSTAASWSTRCTGRPAAWRPSTSRRSIASTRTSATPASTSGTRASRRASPSGARAPRAATSCRSATARSPSG